ncbi:DUF11 domain-containing protein [Leifsonia sp. TF02-11]|uniref:DUF7507 domain-containing protein n=1 Tax=Leifsonia sp. TF02-11 TaxID=2815212 RepID=UPI001AA1C3D8|nr:DUF11 domain-containing protein [Leifsonia sp. TF02-11]MBO1740593.1 hypothetical protein [Leifsonia sp. TF02-11]
MTTHAPSRRGALRPGIVLAATSALLLSLVATALPAATAPAHAAGALNCSGTAIYGEVPGDSAVPSASDVLAIDGNSVGGAELAATLESTSAILGLNQNALGITADGTAAYSASDRGATIMRYDAVNGTWSGFPGETNGSNITAGAVDPVTGIYYFGDVSTSGGTTGHIWGFDTRTNQLISNEPLASFGVPAGQNNGDLAFDGSGNLYLVSSSATDATLVVMQAPLPRTAAEATTIVPTELSTFAVPGGVAVNGIAFDATGTLYLSQGGTNGLFAIDPGTGTLRGALTPLNPAQAGPTGRGLIDLASCAFPPTVSVQKNVVSRVNPTDQFTLTATGATISLPATATTTGTATGLQTTAGGQVLQAGPALARVDDSYTVTETAAGTTDLSRYLTSYRCIDSANPTNPEFPITGAGTTATFTLEPFSTGESPAVVCTFTNEARAASLALTKSASPTMFSNAGDTVDYTYTVTNDGNTPVSAIGITETGFTGSGTPPAPTCATTSLDPGATAQCTASYVVTSADIAAGSVSNTAVATGQDAVTGAVTSPDATAVVTVAPAPALTLTKSVDRATATGPGQIVTYSYRIENTGNVPVTRVAVQEGTFSGSGPAPVVDCPAAAATLAPGASVTCTAPYELTQADADAGHVDNTATAIGLDPAGADVTSAGSTATVTIPAAPGIRLAKTANPSTTTASGQSIGYAFRVTNTGNVTLTAVGITEQSFSGTGGPLAVTCPAQDTIAAGASLTCTADYRVTDADVASGRITNRATAEATDPSGATLRSQESEAVVDVRLPDPPAADRGNVALPDTGGSVTTWLAPLAVILALAGTGIAIMTTRRNRTREH